MAKSKVLGSVYAGFWIRFAALVADTVFLVAMNVAFQFIVLENLYPGALAMENMNTTEGLKARVINFIFQLSVDLAYYWILQTWMMGTPGKFIFGLRVVNTSMKKATYLQMLGRWLMRIPSSLVLGAGYFTVGIHPKKQGWHDRVAGTLVVEKSALGKKSSSRKAA